MVNVVNPPNVNLSQVVIDAGLDLSGGDYDITMKVGRTVDGKDVSGLGDMLKSDYDPDTDNIIEEAQLEPHRKINASDDLLLSNDAEVGYKSDTWALKKAFVVYIGGLYRVKFDMKETSTGTAYGKIYKNGVAHGTEQTRTEATYATFSEDLRFVAGDMIELWGKMVPAAGANFAFVKNFRVYGAGLVTKIEVI